MTLPTSKRLIGLIPAGGKGERIAPLPFSKELYPIGFQDTGNGKGPRLKVVSHYLLEKMKFAGVSTVYIVLRAGKYDIPEYYREGSIAGVSLAYLMIGLTYGVPFTLDRAYPFVQDATVVFGFPDILFKSEDAYARLLSPISSKNADILLGLFPARNELSGEDRIVCDKSGSIRELIPGPRTSAETYSWAIAIWGPRFTEFLHGYVAKHAAMAQSIPEISLGQTLAAAIRTGLQAEGLVIEMDPYLDIGTPENLVLSRSWDERTMREANA